MKIEKVTRKTYDFTIYKNRYEMTWGKFVEARKTFNMSVSKLDKCFLCDKQFDPADELYVGTATGLGNRFICKSCWESNVESEE